MPEPWRPTPPDPCTGPCCTGVDLPATGPEPEPYPTALRECGVHGCIYCPPVTGPGGGDRLPTRKATT